MRRFFLFWIYIFIYVCAVLVCVSFCLYGSFCVRHDFITFYADRYEIYYCIYILNANCLLFQQHLRAFIKCHTHIYLLNPSCAFIASKHASFPRWQQFSSIFNNMFLLLFYLLESKSVVLLLNLFLFFTQRVSTFFHSLLSLCAHFTLFIYYEQKERVVSSELRVAKKEPQTTNSSDGLRYETEIILRIIQSASFFPFLFSCSPGIWLRIREVFRRNQPDTVSGCCESFTTEEVKEKFQRRNKSRCLQIPFILITQHATLDKAKRRKTEEKNEMKQNGNHVDTTERGSFQIPQTRK